jgi:ubiquinone/menaquinone biosynthesis C-methylase UbiE
MTTPQRPTPDLTTSDLTARTRRYWDEQAASYERAGRFERLAFGDSRRWVCDQATGDTLEVAVGTGRNLPLYGEDVRLTAIDLSPGMLAVARERAATLGRPVELREADAQKLPFTDASFDTVVATLSLCSVPDLDATVAELRRVLRPGGRLVLLDHVRPSFPPLRWLLQAAQRRADRSGEGNGEQFLRRPLENVVAQGFELERQERLRAGLLERLTARKPAA